MISMKNPFSLGSLRRFRSIFRRLLGISPEVFDEMVEKLREAWNAREENKQKSGRPSEVGGLEDHLLLLLLYYRCYMTQELLGFFYGLDRSTVCRAIKRIEPIAQAILGVKRDPKLSAAEAREMIVDCTEQPIQRPKDNETQKQHYSGKKKRHTLKVEIIVTKQGRIASISDSCPGSQHDLTLRRKGAALPDDVHFYGDSAYQGYDREHSGLTDIPYKKPKNGELTADKKEHNRRLSSFRVRVEHRIGHAKRFRIMSDRFRNPRHTHNVKFSIVAGLANMQTGFPPC
jgi:DDE superfamily endonuclease/Helix-turn-helix of DDE superfamily endonuclease